MKRTWMPATLASLATLTVASATASGGEQDYMLSVPALGTVERVAADLSEAEAVVTGLSIPHYGHFLEDGALYVPDRGWGGILRVAPDGTVAAVAAGGFFVMPVVLVPDPATDGMIVADLMADRILRVGLDGTQTLLHDAASTGGLIVGPDGIAFDRDGNLYVANLFGDTIVRIDPTGEAALFSDSPLISQPGNLAIDGAGNLYVANYGSNTVARFRLDTGEGEVFAMDVSKMAHPNDLKLSRSHGLLSTTRQSNLVAIDALGAIDVLYHDSDYGEITGIAVLEDAAPCSGTFAAYGAGHAGAGGATPDLRAIFSPCPGAAVALELVDVKGSAPGLLVVGTQPAALKLAGGTLLVDPAGAFFVPLVTPPGGTLRLPFVVPDLPGLVGAQFRFQAVVADAAASGGAAFSNGLLEVVGS